MVKDKNKPKGPMSAYACFVQVIREEHKKKHPEESVVFSEFSKKCAEKWKTMTDKEKQRFDDMASRDKERYIREMDAYIPPDGVKKPRKRRRNKDPGQPKRALSAFFFFCEEKRPAVRAEHPDWKVGDIAKDLGRQWELCQCKGKYESQAMADKSRYEREMIEYKNGTFTSTKRARMEDVLSGETSGYTAAGNGYPMKAEGAIPVYGLAGTGPQTQLPGQPAYDTQPKPEMAAFEMQVKPDRPVSGSSYGVGSAPSDGIPSHPASFPHQGFNQASTQPSSQAAVSQESSAVAVQPQAFSSVMAQDLSASQQHSQPTQSQLQQHQSAIASQMQSQPQAQAQQQPQQTSPQQPQVTQASVTSDISMMQHFPNSGGDSVDMTTEQNGGNTSSMPGRSEELPADGQNADEDEEDEDEEDEETGDE